MYNWMAKQFAITDNSKCAYFYMSKYKTLQEVLEEAEKVNYYYFYVEIIELKSDRVFHIISRDDLKEKLGLFMVME